MALHVTPVEWSRIGLVAAVLAAAGSLATAWLGPAAIAATVAVAAAVVLVFATHLDRRQRLETLERQEAYFRQTEALLALYAMLPEGFTVPATTHWAASADFLRLVADVVRARRPATVVELGSGVSTVVCAALLPSSGGGRLISLEHDEACAAATRAALDRAGVGDVASVRVSPLRSARVGGGTQPWYDLEPLDDVRTIDLLVIDGPPEHSAPLARYPAIPLLFDRLADDATILLDDGKRGDERAAVERWLKEHDALDAEYLDLKHGAWVLRCRRRASD